MKFNGELFTLFGSDEEKIEAQLPKKVDQISFPFIVPLLSKRDQKAAPSATAGFSRPILTSFQGKRDFDCVRFTAIFTGKSSVDASSCHRKLTELYIAQFETA